MQNRSIRNSRTAAVAAGAAVLVALGGVSGAFAAAKITSADIKNGQVKKIDIGRNQVGASELIPGTIGLKHLNGTAKDRINQSATQGNPHFVGAHWGIIDRNVIGNGDADLRPGPSFATATGVMNPPSGVGSLGIRTGSGTDKTAFGNQVDFAGDALADVDAVKYSVFTTGENAAVAEDNLPNVAVEVDTDSTVEGLQYSTLVFTPAGADANAWTEVDATTAKRWYFTGGVGDTTGCNQVTYCTLAEVKEKAPHASILTVAITKGRDHAFSGAVDNLVWDDTTYDFEPFGVVAR